MLNIKSRLQRVTTSGGIIPVIDGLRFIAIAGVLLFHFWGYTYAGEGEPTTLLGEIFTVSWFGVELFFVISGFILAKGFVEAYLGDKEKVSLKAYFLRRLTRLEPPYILALLVYFAIKTYLLGEEGLLPHLLASMFYVHNFVYGEASRVLGVAWSLEIEIQFYILVPVLSRVFMIQRKAVRRSVICAGIILSQIVAANIPAFPQSVFGFLYLFLTGFLLCDIYYVDWKNGKEIPVRWYWDILGALSWFGLFLVLRHYFEFRFLIPIFIFIAYVAAFCGPIFRRIFSNPFVYITGGMCYTIYLYHTVIIKFIATRTPFTSTLDSLLGPSLAPLVACCIAFVAVVGLCSVMFILFEKPFMRRDWPQQFAAFIRSRNNPKPVSDGPQDDR